MSIYLERFSFPTAEDEFGLYYRQPSVYNNLYPASVLTHKLDIVEFAPVTIFYGGNGSGKSTALNLIAEKLGIKRTTPYNKSTFFEKYAKMLCCANEHNYTLCKKIITSDDVFKSIFETRSRNEKIDTKREELYDEYEDLRFTKYVVFKEDKNMIEHIDELKDINAAKKKKYNATDYVRGRAEKNVIGKSNGETALDFFMKELKEPGLYLLDEPENSLSASFQVELGKFLYESARFFECQLVIATHSPFILSIPGARIYNLDNFPSEVTDDWTSLENMRVYYEFFKEYKNRFE